METNRPRKKWSVFKIILLSSACCILLGIGLVVWYVVSLFSVPDLSQAPAYYPFKSEQAKERYYNYYDTRARQWPVPSEAKYVKTSFGKTFVRISGPANAPGLVLLPSSFASSLFWIPNIPALAAHFRVYAVDNIYDVGRSVNTRPIQGPDDLAPWLDEVCASLELGDSINMMGLSFGGWLTSQYALRFPSRLHKIVLVAPVATILPLPAEWAWRGILGALPGRFFMTHFLTNWMSHDLVKKKDAFSRGMVMTMMDDAMMAMKCYKFRMPITPTVLSDKELQSLKMPVLFLVGEHEVLYPAREAVRRLNTVAPAIRTGIIPGAGHDLTVSQTEIVDDKVIKFLQE